METKVWGLGRAGGDCCGVTEQETPGPGAGQPGWSLGVAVQQRGGWAPALGPRVAGRA